MDTITLYHNPRCSKSRATLELVQNYLDGNQADLKLSIVEYLQAPPAPSELENISSMLNVPLRQIMRTKESAFSDHNLNDTSSDAQLLDAIVQSPILLERPILVFAGKAAIGRPPENVLNILPSAKA